MKYVNHYIAVVVVVLVVILYDCSVKLCYDENEVEVLIVVMRNKVYIMLMEKYIIYDYMQ